MRSYDAAGREQSASQAPPWRLISRRKSVSQALVCSGPVQPERSTFSLAGAGSVLIGFTAACIVVGTLIGWAIGKVGYGLAFGAVVGIPVGVAATVIKYRNI
jgi:hypothetical protein